VTLEQLRHLVELAADRRLSPLYPIYELHAGRLPFSRRTRSLAERQLQVFQALRRLGWPVFVARTTVPAVTGAWAHAVRETWALPRELESAELLGSQLAAGGWKAYLALEPVDRTAIPDLFTGSFAEAFETVEALGIPVLIDASADNTGWRVLLQPAATEVRAVA
jgi:hypothetical protein